MSNHIVKEEIIGYFGVDSGTVMIIDPCYVLKDESEPGVDFDHSTEYLRTVMPTCEAPYYGGVVLDNYPDVPDMGVVCRTLYGDGEYPVIAEFNSEGRIVRLTIDFDPDIEEEEDDEYEYTCDRCGDHLPDGDGHYTDNGERICDDCDEQEDDDEEQ